MKVRKKSYLNWFLIKPEIRITQGSVVKDRITGLSTLVSVFTLLENRLATTAIGLIYIDIKDFKNIEDVYGGDVCNKILKNTGEVLKNMKIDFAGPRSKIAVCSLGGDDFMVFIEAPEATDNYETEYLKVKQTIEEKMNQANHQLSLYRPLSIHLGYTEIKYKPDAHIESLTYKAIKEASTAAKQYAHAEEHAKLRAIRQIIDQKQIRTVFQPIFSLKTGAVLGYEALSRGPMGTAYESPSQLFAIADDFQCLQELENLCHSTAIQSIGTELRDNYLFVNVNPLILNPNNYEKGLMQNAIRDSRLRFKNVVLELTERTEVQDYAQLRESLRYYRNQGFVIAIDDAGSGYSSLAAIAELQPEFVKIDMSLIRDIDKSPTKKAMLETLLGFASKVNARIICEGIETEEELKVLCSIGCDYGQGFFLARPGNLGQVINPQAREHIKPAANVRLVHANLPEQIGDITIISQAITPDLAVNQVIDTFRENKFINGLVVCEDLIPRGLIMREKLFAMLSTRYGYDLFINRSIAEIMDRNILVLPYDTSLEEAAQLVAERLDRGVNDYLVITRDESYYGIVSNAKLLDTMAKIHIKNAQDANPLTGLPGNKCISSRLINDLDAQRSMMVMYFDLDNFKSFNDYYGFEHGDQALVLLANVINQAVQIYGNTDDLVGHIGGDDFIVITSPDKATSVADEVIRLFSQRITELYDEADLEMGYIVSANRQGEMSRIPIMSVSIAGVSTENNHYDNHLQISETAAEIKKQAKTVSGNCYLVDQRKNVV